MHRKLLALSITFAFVLAMFSPLPAAASSAYSIDGYLSIVTSDNRPISIDRLLYTAFRDIHYHTDFTPFALRTGYEMADNGDRDGVISSTPYMEQTYPNLRKVPVPIEQTEMYAFVGAGSGLEINDWSDLSGLRVAIMPQRTYLLSQIPGSASVITGETSQALFDLIIQDKCDVAVFAQRSHEEIWLPDEIERAANLETLPEYLYLNKEHEQLIPEITDALNRIFADGRGDKILNDITVSELIPKKTVLHIVSSNNEVEREDRFYSKLRDVLKDDDDIEWYTISLSSRRYALAPNRLSNIAQIIRQDCVSRDVAAIIVSNADALQFMSEYYLLYFRNVPIIFYGIDNDYQAEAEAFESRFTGILETVSAEETVSAALRLFPDTKNILVVNDHTSEGSNYRAAAEEQLAKLSEKLNIRYNENISREDLLADIWALPPDSLVFIGSYFVDGSGHYFSKNEMTRALERNSSVPIFTLYSGNGGYNAIGGLSPDYEIYAETVAGMLKKLLSGKGVSPLISESAGYNRWVFDKVLMDKWGIKESSLPMGARIINKTPSIWESDPRFAITLIILLVLGVTVAAGVPIFVLKYRKQQELLEKDAKIREVKERQERIISSAPVSILIAVDGEVVEVNDAYKNDTGLDIGCYTESIYHNPTDRDFLVKRVMEEGVVKNEVIKLRFADGSVHRCLVNCTTVDYDGRTAIVMWAVDIERDEIKKDQLQMARQSLQAMLDTMLMPVAVADMETEEIVYGNNAYLELFEFDSPDSLLGTRVSDTLAGIMYDGVDPSMVSQEIMQTWKSVDFELKCRTAKDKILDVRLITQPIDYNGRKSVLAIMTDLAAEKEYERMLLNTAEKEKEANQLKGRFLVNMSHEIRTPMNAIIGFTEIEQRKNPPKETAEVYRKINASAKNLLHIINDILDLSKIEADKVELFSEEFELEDVVNSALLVATPRLDGKNVEFMLNAALDLPRFVVGDRTRLWQILKNFLDNAAKYTEHGKIILSVSVDQQKSDAEKVAVSFVVKDSGIGISQEQMQKLFMPYGQIYNDAQKRYTGTGLGMVISKQLCELMGGAMEIESNLGEGTRISFTIPFKRSQNGEKELQSIIGESLSGVNILAVDDDETSLEIMETLLKGSGARCEMARSGEEAMKIILERRDRNKLFDLILLDYMMDGLNGLETARQIQSSLSRAPKFLMVTAYQRLLLKDELLKNGIDDVIEKPFIPSQFIHKLCVAMGCDDGFTEKKEEVFTRFANVHVLLCEDYLLNQEVAVGMFSQFGITATIAENGREGVDILNSGKTFDLIFMDLQMPVMNGYEAARVIRSDSRFNQIPIISLTADAMKEVVDKCREAGMNDHIAKPIEFSSLHKIFLKWLPESKRIVGDVTVKMDAVNKGLERFGGNKERYEKALREFARLLPDKWVDFDDAVADMEKTKREIHKIKGAAGNLSENDVYQSAIEFESSLRLDKPDKELYERLIDASAAFKARISGQMEEPDASPASEGTSEELAARLSALKDALQSYNPKATTNAVKALKEKTWPDTSGDKLEQLVGLALKYEFDDALTVLDSMNMEEK